MSKTNYLAHAAASLTIQAGHIEQACGCPFPHGLTGDVDEVRREESEIKATRCNAHSHCHDCRALALSLTGWEERESDGVRFLICPSCAREAYELLPPVEITRDAPLDFDRIEADYRAASFSVRRSTAHTSWQSAPWWVVGVAFVVTVAAVLCGFAEVRK